MSGQAMQLGQSFPEGIALPGAGTNALGGFSGPGTLGGVAPPQPSLQTLGGPMPSAARDQTSGPQNPGSPMSSSPTSFGGYRQMRQAQTDADQESRPSTQTFSGFGG